MILHKSFLIIALKVILLALTLISRPSFAEPPLTINYRGFLQTSSGESVTDTISLSLMLYTMPTDGIEVWSESHVNVEVRSGHFSITLGALSPIPTTLFNTPLFLGVLINGTDELLPRRVISSQAAAMHSKVADGLQDGTLTGPKFTDATISPSKLAATCSNGQILIRIVTGWACGPFP